MPGALDPCLCEYKQGNKIFSVVDISGKYIIKPLNSQTPKNYHTKKKKRKKNHHTSTDFSKSFCTHKI